MTLTHYVERCEIKPHVAETTRGARSLDHTSETLESSTIVKEIGQSAKQTTQRTRCDNPKLQHIGESNSIQAPTEHKASLGTRRLCCCSCPCSYVCFAPLSIVTPGHSCTVQPGKPRFILLTLRYLAACTTARSSAGARVWGI